MIAVFPQPQSPSPTREPSFRSNVHLELDERDVEELLQAIASGLRRCTNLEPKARARMLGLEAFLGDFSAASDLAVREERCS